MEKFRNVYTHTTAKGNQPFKSICWLLGPRAKKPTLGVQHALEAGNLKTMLLIVLAFVL